MAAWPTPAAASATSRASPAGSSPIRPTSSTRAPRPAATTATSHARPAGAVGATARHAGAPTTTITWPSLPEPRPGAACAASVRACGRAGVYAVPGKIAPAAGGRRVGRVRRVGRMRGLVTPAAVLSVARGGRRRGLGPGRRLGVRGVHAGTVRHCRHHLRGRRTWPARRTPTDPGTPTPWRKARARARARWSPPGTRRSPASTPCPAGTAARRTAAVTGLVVVEQPQRPGRDHPRTGPDGGNREHQCHRLGAGGHREAGAGRDAPRVAHREEECADGAMAERAAGEPGGRGIGLGGDRDHDAVREARQRRHGGAARRAPRGRERCACLPPARRG